MHENDISMYKNEYFAPGMIFSPQNISWVGLYGLYTTSYIELSPMNIFGHNVPLHAWNFDATIFSCMKIFVLDPVSRPFISTSVFAYACVYVLL